MTVQQKMDWLANATPDELLRQYVSFVNNNHFGKNDEDIALTRSEIVRRMEGKHEK